MFITTASSVHRSFTGVDYAVFEDGELHIGKTIKNYLSDHRYNYQWLAEQIHISKSGISELVRKSSIHTDRLSQISKAVHHDFFQYYTAQISGVEATEPKAVYEKPKRKKIVLEIEGDEVVNQRVVNEEKTMEEVDLNKSLIEMREMQEVMWKVLQRAIPDIAREMNLEEGRNPLTSDNEEMKKKD
jgi:hypothetical protein